MVLRAPMTNRQMDTLSTLAIGKTNRQIGKHLDIAEKTVRVHLPAIYKNLRVRTRTEAGFVAARNGMVTIRSKSRLPKGACPPRGRLSLGPPPHAL